MVCAVGKADVDLATRKRQLLEVAEKWCKRHLNKHLTANERTLKLPHGKVGFREQTPKVQFTDGVTEKIFIERLEQKCGIIAAVTTLLKKVLGVFTVEQFVRFRPEINKVDLKAAWDAKPKARATLKELGITVKAGDDLVVIDPEKHRVAKPAL